MAADKLHLLLVSDVDLILQDFRLFLGVARKDAFQSPVGVTLKPHSRYLECGFTLYLHNRRTTNFNHTLSIIAGNGINRIYSTE